MQVMIDNRIVLSSQALSRFLVHSSNALFDARIHELANMAQKSCVLTGARLDYIEILLVVSGSLKYLTRCRRVKPHASVAMCTPYSRSFWRRQRLLRYMEFQAYRN